MILFLLIIIIFLSCFLISSSSASLVASTSSNYKHCLSNCFNDNLFKFLKNLSILCILIECILVIEASNLNNHNYFNYTNLNNLVYNKLNNKTSLSSSKLINKNGTLLDRDHDKAAVLNQKRSNLLTNNKIMPNYLFINDYETRNDSYLFYNIILPQFNLTSYDIVSDIARSSLSSASASLNLNNNNKTSLIQLKPNWNHPLLGLVLITMTLITIFGNGLVIFAVVRERHLKSATNYYIASLACADLIVGFAVMPFNSFNKMTDNFWFFGDLW